MEIHINEILDYLERRKIQYTYNGNKEGIILGLSPANNPRPNTLTFIRKWDECRLKKISEISDLFIVCDSQPAVLSDNNYIIVNDPHRIYFSITNDLFETCPNSHNPSMLCINSMSIGKNFECGEFVFVGKDVVIGDNCKIGTNVTINGKVRIGDGAFIDSNVCIGSEGYGHYQSESDIPIMIHHHGGVIIGNNVFIGGGTVIAKGTIDDTVIGNDVKIDAMCKVSHNAQIGDRVMMAGNSGVAGSVIIGDDTWLSGGCKVNSGIAVGKNCFIGFCSVVTKNIPDGKKAIGFPARIMGDNVDNPYKI